MRRKSMVNNLLSNSGFDNQFNHWTRSGNVELVTGVSARNNGTSVKLSAVHDGGFSSVEQSFSVQPGKSYVVSFWVRGTNRLQVGHSFGYRNSSEKWTAYSTAVFLNATDNNEYRRITRQFVFPNDITSTIAYIQINAASPMSESGEAYIDDIEVYEQEFLSDPAHPSGISYYADESFEMSPYCNADTGIVVDPANARTGYKAIRLLKSTTWALYVPDANGGKAYTVSFYAKSQHDNTRISVRYYYRDANGDGKILSAGLSDVLSTSYQRYEMRIPIPFTAQALTHVYFSVTSSSSDCEAWIDDCKVTESSVPFKEWNYAKTIVNQVKVRNEPRNNTEEYTYVATGCMLPIVGCVTGDTQQGSNRWVEVRWCVYNNGVLTPTTRYIHESVVEEVINLNPSVKYLRVLDVAKSLVNTKGSDLNLKGEWCQLLLNWLCYVADVNPLNFPANEGVTSDAVEFFADRNRYYARDENPSFIPYAGLWIYYKNRNSNDTMSHVGLIVSRNGNSLTCIEGNLGTEEYENRKVKQITIDDYTAQYVTVNNIQKEIKGFGFVPYT